MYGYFTVSANAAPLPPIQGLVLKSGAAVIKSEYGSLMYVIPVDRAEAFEHTLEALAGPGGYIRSHEPLPGFTGATTTDFTNEFLALSVL